jgi:uncharacterized protein DUF4158
MAGTKRRPHNRLGWAVQWGTVRMLGTFLSQPAKVPPGVAAFVADQLGIADTSLLAGYPERLPTQHEHAREVRGGCGDGAAQKVSSAPTAARMWAGP